MSKMKDSGVKWIGSVDKDFRILRLKNVCNVMDEYRQPVTANLRSQDAPILYDYYGASGAIDKIDGYTIDDDVLLIGEDGANLRMRNLPLVYQVHGKAWINNHTHIVKPLGDELDYFYAFYMLESLDINPYITGSAQPKFNQESLRNLYIIVPPMEVQKKIVSFLNTKCSDIDVLCGKIQSEIDILSEYKKTVITESVTKGLDANVELKYSDVFYMAPYNSSWCLSKIGYVCSKLWRTFESGDTALLCTNKGKVTLRPPEMLGKMVSEDNAMQGIRKGDIAIHGMDTWHGAIALSEYDGKITRVVHVCDSTQDKRFIVYYLQQLAFNGVYKLISNGVRGNTSDFRSWDKVKNIYIALPPIAEQRKIADYLDRKCAEVDAVIKDKQEMLATLAEYKKSMIYEYVTGKKEIPAVKDDVVVLFDPNALWLGCIVDKLGKEQRGRTQIQKIKYLLDVHCGINPNNQYYRYNHGPYDINLNDHLGSLVGKKWFKQEHGKTITLTAGECHADFQNICKERIGDKEPVIDGFLSLLQSMKVMKTSRLERIATLYAVWNDFLLDGITPTDDQIIQEVLSNWTENKAHSQYETWQDSLNKMKKHGLIPKGTGLHTLPKPEKDGGEAE